MRITGLLHLDCCKSIHPSICLPACLPVCLPACLSLCLSISYLFIKNNSYRVDDNDILISSNNRNKNNSDCITREMRKSNKTTQF